MSARSAQYLRTLAGPASRTSHSVPDLSPETGQGQLSISGPAVF